MGPSLRDTGNTYLENAHTHMQTRTLQIQGRPTHGLLIPGCGFLKPGTMCSSPDCCCSGCVAPLCNAAAFLACVAHYSVLIIDRAPSLGQRSHWSGRSRVGFPRGDLITPPAHSHLAPAFRMNWRGQLCSCAAGLNFHFHRFARVAQFSNGWSQQALLDLVLIMCSQEVSYANKEHAGKKTSVTFNHLARDEDDCQSRCRPCVFSRYCRNLKSFLCADQVLASQSSAASFIPLSSIKLKHLENQEPSHQTSCSH